MFEGLFLGAVFGSFLREKACNTLLEANHRSYELERHGYYRDKCGNTYDKKGRRVEVDSEGTITLKRTGEILFEDYTRNNQLVDDVYKQHINREKIIIKNAELDNLHDGYFLYTHCKVIIPDNPEYKKNEFKIVDAIYILNTKTKAYKNGLVFYETKYDFAIPYRIHYYDYLEEIEKNKRKYNELVKNISKDEKKVIDNYINENGILIDTIDIHTFYKNQENHKLEEQDSEQREGVFYNLLK